jgi:hypothetical protein
MDPTYLLIALVVINTVASIFVLRASALTTQQRLLQLALIWFLPVAGAIVSIVFVSSLTPHPTSQSTIDPLYYPGDGGAIDPPGTSVCGCAGGDGGSDGGGD